ncbi:sensor histidine kinase [Pedobacter sp. ISL-68]|uniref:tetratricopeptide repeat-containing sensor histidine kinase n=1 Tax=unclassified Pedobacter TaxID=2628915 RepID=UPI001BE73FF4|nr:MULTISPECIES: sensor histidine kinase [unclassified Pedobacter]MBT2560264.1 sensor histidine kinase [Pedobacter sp. ISL-64]MBT2589244.1 sensor histidine kinase [Pedobacter sp. ISL-68]
MIKDCGACNRLLRLSSWIVFFCFSVCSGPASAQYYYPPLPVMVKDLKAINADHKLSSTNSNKNALAYSLAQHYFNKATRSKTDLQSALQNALTSVSLSRKLRDTVAIDRALLVLGYTYLAQREFEKAEGIVLTINSEEMRLKMLSAISFFYWSSAIKNADYQNKSLSYSRASLKLARRLKDPLSETISLNNIAVAHGNLNEKNAEKELLGLLKRYQQTVNPHLEYPCFYLAEYYLRNDRSDKATEYSLLAAQSLAKNKNAQITGDIYFLQTRITYNNEHFSDALAFGFRAIEAYSRMPGIIKVSDPDITLYIGRAYQKLNQHRRALAFMLKRQTQFPPADISQQMAYVSMLGHIHRGLKEFHKGELYFKQFEKMSRQYGLDKYAAQVNLGQLYLDWQHYEEARPYLKTALKDERLLLTGARRHLHYMAFLADSATRNFEGAMKHMIYLNDQAESGRRKEVDQALKRWEVSYGKQKSEEQLKLKNQNIKLLLQRNLAQQQKARQDSQIRNLIAAGFVFVLIILLLLYYQYRQKQKSNRIILFKSIRLDDKNKVLEKLVKEKNYLLKEVHHRVKNNLHTIFCLLESQAIFLKDDALVAIESSRNRIFAMSLLHQKLYQSDNIKQVDMSHYFSEFLIFLRRSYGLEARNIDIYPQIQPLELDVTVAIPLALIVNEAVTNAIKHAFPADSGGRIDITLIIDPLLVTLMVKDNGVGFELSNRHNDQSFGLELMRGLSQDINAKISFEVQQGTTIKITFALEEEQKNNEFGIS